MSDVFEHVVCIDHINDLSWAIRVSDEINLAYAPLIIDPKAQAYIDGLDLSPNGEFAHITNPNGHDPSIGQWKSLYYSGWVKDPADFNPDLLEASMTEMPDRVGKKEFSALLSQIAKAYWPARESPNGMSMSLMLKYAASNPKFHIDDGVTRRGLVCLRGNSEKGATKILDNNAVNFWQKQENGYPFLNPVGEAGKDFEIQDHQMMHLPMNCMSIHEGYKHRLRPGFLVTNDEKTRLTEVYTQLFMPDIMAAQNPLVHSEPSLEECPEPRLQIMLG